MTVMAESKDQNPWRLYGKEYRVPKSKMGKARDDEEEKSMEKSLQKLEEMAKSVAPDPGDEAIALLKSCAVDMTKSDEKKAYLGELAIPEKKGAKPIFTGSGAMRAGSPAGGGGVVKPGSEKIIEAKKMGGQVKKAVTASSIPRIPRALAQEMIRRNAQNVMTRGNSRFAEVVGTAPLQGELLEEVDSSPSRRIHAEVYKSCGQCGRRYMEKSFPNGCPTCGMNKSQHCSKCGTYLHKSHGGSVFCPLCG